MLNYINQCCLLITFAKHLEPNQARHLHPICLTSYPYVIPSRGQNISILHLSYRTCEIQFSLILKHMHLSFKSICNKEHKGVICNMTSWSNSWRISPPLQISLIITRERVEFLSLPRFFFQKR